MRKKIEHSSPHASQARVFNIYERAVFRHPGCVTLWREYLDYAAKVKATKRWKKIVTRALRLHPMDVALWKLAGRRAAIDGDMEGSRGFFMRGCRFCNSTPELWVEYARVEMEWLERQEKKKGGKEKGHEASNATHAVDEGDVMMFDDDDDDDEFGNGADGDVIIPDPLADEENKRAKEARKALEGDALKKLEKSPAMEGAIPKAIFDVAQKQPFWNAATGEVFFDMFAIFTSVSAQETIIQHVLNAMVEAYPIHPSTCSCLIRQPLIGVDVTTAAFPRALREVLARIKTQTEKTEDKDKLAAKTTAWINHVLANKELDTGVRTVLEHTKRKLEAS